ncbi:MAG: autotransporter-associated beta strand repeat-containing protein [Kiritimatiellia bacterium]
MWPRRGLRRGRGRDLRGRPDRIGTIKSGYSGYPSTITFGVDNGSGTFSGVLANSQAAGNFTKAGSGTQTLANANTYTGATIVNGGVLNLAASQTIGSAIL